MKRLIFAAAVALAAGSTANAGELNNESSVTNQSMNGTVVIRVDTRNNQAAILTTETAVSNNSQAQQLALEGQFKKVSAENVKNELDNDGGASSWYFYGGSSYYYSSMYWYGSWYHPCYSYNYSYYNYYYYSNHWW